MSTQRQASVYIVILNYNGLSDTLECLASLRHMHCSHELRICVIDNGSVQDESPKLREAIGSMGTGIRSDTNLGFARGCNVGLSFALDESADYIVLLNNDTVVDQEFVNELVKAAQADDRVGVVGAKIFCHSAPTILWSTGGYVNWWLGDIEELDSYKPDQGGNLNPQPREWVSGCAMLVKRQVLERVSLLDEEFFMGGEDYEFCVRVVRAGYKVIHAPSAKVWHKVSASKAMLLKDRESLQRFIRSEGATGIKTRLRFFRKCAIWPPALVPMSLCICYSYPKFVARQLFVYKRGGAVWRALIRWGRSIAVRV